MNADTCDRFQLGMESECPGVTVHCATGEHCTTWDATCAATEAVQDHPAACCICKAAIS